MSNPVATLFLTMHFVTVRLLLPDIVIPCCSLPVMLHPVKCKYEAYDLSLDFRVTPGPLLKEISELDTEKFPRENPCCRIPPFEQFVITTWSKSGAFPVTVMPIAAKEILTNLNWDFPFRVIPVQGSLRYACKFSVR